MQEVTTSERRPRRHHSPGLPTADIHYAMRERTEKTVMPAGEAEGSGALAALGELQCWLAATGRGTKRILGGARKFPGRYGGTGRGQRLLRLGGLPLVSARTPR
jgi:hypothetical protein